MKVWVVTEGSYSDFHIERIFSTEKKAVDFVGDNDDLRIEEWSVDDAEGKKGTLNHIVSIDGAGNDFDRYVKSIGRIEDEHFKGRTWVDSERMVGNQITGLVFVGESPVNREHALKLAIELRQEWLRNGSPTPETWEEYYEQNEKFGFMRRHDLI